MGAIGLCLGVETTLLPTGESEYTSCCVDDDQRFQAALSAHRNGDLARAETGYRDLLVGQPDQPALYVNLAAVRTTLGHPEEAVRLLEQALALAPEHTNAWSQLGVAYAALGRMDDAERAYGQAIARDERHVAALNNWALVCATRHHYDRARSLYERALAVDPANVSALGNFGAMLVDAGRLGDAEATLRRALALSPSDPGAHVNLANALTRRGRAIEALPHLVSGITNHGSDPSWHSNLLMTLHYPEGPSRADIFGHHLRWARMRSVDRTPAGVHRGRTRREKLRIGYVSPDFRSHAVAFFIAPLLQAHDRSRFEIHGYASVQVEDAMTARLGATCDSWCNVFALGDDALVDRIRADGIDVLVDLAGHTAGNRLSALARNPAPVQMSYLGYPDTTGVAAIGYRLTDRWCDPPGSEAFHSETLLHVLGGLHCYEPPQDAPPVTSGPAARSGHLTFGSFNNTSKVSETVVARWARLLRAIPSSRMYMKFPTLTDPSTAAQYRGWFERQGIAAARVTLRGSTYSHGSHLADHAEVDVILDAFPYHGTTTTCEALWMGVPVLSLVGESHVSRVALSLLSQVGLERFAVGDETTLLERAADLASPSGHLELAALRATLRGTMATSPLCSGIGKARALEACFDWAWEAFERATPSR